MSLCEKGCRRNTKAISFVCFDRIDDVKFGGKKMDDEREQRGIFEFNFFSSHKRKKNIKVCRLTLSLNPHGSLPRREHSCGVPQHPNNRAEHAQLTQHPTTLLRTQHGHRRHLTCIFLLLLRKWVFNPVAHAHWLVDDDANQP